MKKWFLYLFSLIVVFGLTIPVSAQEDVEHPKEKVIHEAKEIKDLNVLFAKAKRETNVLQKYKVENNSSKENNGLEVKEYKTSQVLKVKLVGDTQVEEIAETTFTIVNDPQEVSIASTGSKYEESWDDSIGVKAYSTIYFTKTTSGGIEYGKLTSISGGWSRSDTTISLSGRKVTFGQSGWPAGSQTKTVYPTGNTWNYTAPSTWDAVSLDADYTLGATSTVTLTRGTRSSWTLKLSNNL